MKNKIFNIIAPIIFDEDRIDKFLQSNLKELSRTRIQSIIKNGNVRLNNKIITNPSKKIKGKQNFKSFNYNIPSDISSSAFFIVLTLLSDDSKLIIEKVGVNKSRTGVIDILNKMGALIGREWIYYDVAKLNYENRKRILESIIQDMVKRKKGKNTGEYQYRPEGRKRSRLLGLSWEGKTGSASEWVKNKNLKERKFLEFGWKKDKK